MKHPIEENNGKVINLDNGLYEKQVGTTCVDSGTIVITDPCYVMNDCKESDCKCNNHLDYDDFCTRYGKALEKGRDYVPLSNSNEALGTIHSTRYGDGIYPIIATYDNKDMVVSIRVDFGSN